MTTCPTCRTDRPTNKGGEIRRHACVAVGGETFALPYAQPPMTKNQQRRMHHHAEAKLRAEILNTCRWAIRAARLEPRVGANVVLHWRVANKRRQDGDGAAPTLSIVIDALVLEGVLPDDSWIHVPHSGVTCHPPLPKMPGSLWIELTDPDGGAS